MEAIKLERIKSLEKEVTQFHPVLNALFPRLPNIISHEYRQGPNEMGADFVLEKYDELIETTFYIGVIVKVGKIKQDHSEIERQIEECEIERFYENGKKKIFLSEIWIINNDSITEGAQKKIHAKHKNSKITFLDLTKITKLIDKFYPEYWTDVSVSLGKHLRDILDISERIFKGNHILDIQEDINLEQKIVKLDSKIKPDKGRPKRTQYYTIHEALQKDSLIFLEGSMGSGKSSLLKMLVKKLASPETINHEKTIPILKTFKEFLISGASNIEEIFSQTAVITKTDPSEYNYLLILDGLDETQLDIEKKLELLINISQTVHNNQNFKVIVTSRPIENIKYRTEITKYFCRYQICHLSTQQLINFIKKICDNDKALAKLESGLERSPLFKTLPRTPISAILLGKILREDPAELPSTMTELYSKYIELVLGRWDMSKGLESQREFDIISNICMNIGHYIITNSLESISTAEARNFFKTYIKQRNIKLDPDAIYEKFLSKTEIVSYNHDTLTIKFRHRTFAEYFTARKNLRDQTAHIDESAFDPYWATSFFFYIGLLRDCPTLIDALTNTSIEKYQHKITRIFQTGQYLLAAYLTPYESIKTGVETNFRKAAELIDEAFKGDTPLSKLPPMQLIYSVTHGLAYSFGYEYFQDAIQEAACKILSTENPSDTDLVQLFLLNSTHGYLGSNDAFDNLVVEHFKELPEYLQLGVYHISEDFKLNSSVTKKYVKKMQKSFKARGNVQELMKHLYETPIMKEQPLTASGQVSGK